MGYYNNLSIETRTCGEADEDARLDRRDGLTSRMNANRARWQAAHKRLDAMDAIIGDTDFESDCDDPAPHPWVIGRFIAERLEATHAS